MKPITRAFPALLAIAALWVGASSASADALQEVWSFSGGAVAIQRLPDGTYQGTVVEPTTFAVCQHPVGQVMWTDIRRQPDGSYWGLHQWFHGPGCKPDGPFGLTAWRVLSGAEGSRLEVCFNSPGDQSQPRIEADGSSADVTYGCAKSEPLGPVPGSDPSSPELGIEDFVGLPPNSACGRRRHLRILLRHLRYDPLAEVVVWVNGRKVAVADGKKASKPSLLVRNLPNKAFRLRILAVTVLHQHYWQKRAYPACSRTRKIRLPKGSATSRR